MKLIMIKLIIFVKIIPKTNKLINYKKLNLRNNNCKKVIKNYKTKK